MNRYRPAWGRYDQRWLCEHCNWAENHAYQCRSCSAPNPAEQRRTNPLHILTTLLGIPAVMFTLIAIAVRLNPHG